MTTRYSTALSHIVLAGTGIFCYLVAKDKTPYIFAKCSFGTIILHSVIGIWRWGNPIYGPGSDKLYKVTAYLQDYLVLPSLVSSVILQYGFISELAYAYSTICFIPIITNANNEPPVNHSTESNIDIRVPADLLSTVILFNCVTLGTITYMYQNYFGVAASISYAFNYFIIRHDRETFFQVTSQDIYNYSMCFFAYFSLKTVLD